MADREVPEIWWSPLGGGLMVKVQDGRMRFLDLTEHDPVDLPEDAVRLAPLAIARDIASFCAERAGFITAINNCHPDNVADYHRWQGHAEARRQLAERLGLPTAWPAKGGEVTDQPTPDATALLAEVREIAASLRLEADRFRSGEVSADDPRPLDRRLAATADDVDEIAWKIARLWSPSSPLPDTETEWGCRDRHGQVHSTGVENDRQARAMRSMTPVRREVGPWTEAPRG